MTILRHRMDEARVGMMFLTRIPMGHVAEIIPLGRTAWVWPLAGVAAGSAMAAGVAVTGWTALPQASGIILGMALSLWITGGLHEDGLADCADGIGGGGDRDKRLAIMRDSRIGSYGVLALMAVLALQASLWTAAAEILPQAMAIGLLSRAFLPLWMLVFTPARPTGLGGGTRVDLTRARCAVAICLGIGGAVAAVGPAACGAAIAAIMAQMIVFLAAKRGLGGFTGDVVGAAQVLGQTAALAALVQVQ